MPEKTSIKIILFGLETNANLSSKLTQEWVIVHVVSRFLGQFCNSYKNVVERFYKSDDSVVFIQQMLPEQTYETKPSNNKVQTAATTFKDRDFRIEKPTREVEFVPTAENRVAMRQAVVALLQ
ncbi:hypothetical protein HHI36_017165 [Cryptolaemus montrouzieri]|uniref:Uncharacterized protein n=1 Tax=Cryptolaemus montrouzieri TaxID=559131 RepID=A0ABD2NM67_9CUCU